MINREFKKNDKVVARAKFADWLTIGKKYTVLGVKQYPNNILLLIAHDKRQRKYIDADHFWTFDEAMTKEEKEIRENLENRSL